MADFRQSLSAGVAASVTAAENKKQINSLVQEVNDQVSEAYEGKVHFGMWNLSKSVREKDAIANIFMDALNYENINYTALCISNTIIKIR